MKFTLSWLKQHLETQSDAAAIAEKLTALGLEVENLRDPGTILRPFTVARVIEAKQHPDADRLRVCRVDTGAGIVEVVCGAPNARTGMKAVFAAVGAIIPGTGDKLKATTIRGVVSQGMLCSMREMGLSDEHAGIIELPAEAPVGQPFAPVLGLDDPLFDIAITPNRADCLGVHGIARDLAAAGLGRLTPIDTTPVQGAFKSPIDVRLDFPETAKDACPLFLGRMIRGVKNRPSPEWLQRRLTAIGLRPISALVDITNFLTFDCGRPLHVFDAGRVKGSFTVRLSRSGENLKALDGKSYTLDDAICVIADESGPISLGGVMGGENTGVTDGTTDVFVEAALFDPRRTAGTGRKLGIESDARYRFERGLDPAFVTPGMEIATRLIQTFCGGAASEVVVAGTVPSEVREIDFDPAYTRRLGGIEVAPERQHAILKALGFEIAKKGTQFRVAVPSWRSDIESKADLVEEVARVVGYDFIAAVALPDRPVVARPAIGPEARRRALLRHTLAAHGLMEAVTWSFVASATARAFGGGTTELLLVNPISADLDAMRPSLLINLIAAAGRNAAYGMGDLGLFEIGAEYRDTTIAGQREVAAGIRRGLAVPRHWAAAARPVDTFDAKADALAALNALGVAEDNLQTAAEAPVYYHPGRSGLLKLGPQTTVAAFGEVHPAILKMLDVSGPLVAFEIYLDVLPKPKPTAPQRLPSSAARLPSVDRDFAFIVDREVPAERVMRAARQAARELITRISLFDLYQGAGIEPNQKSIALSIRLTPKTKTLTESEIEAAANQIVAAVAKATGGRLRG